MSSSSEGLGAKCSCFLPSPLSLIMAVEAGGVAVISKQPVLRAGKNCL